MTPQELEESLLVVALVVMMGGMAAALFGIQRRKRRLAEQEMETGRLRIPLQSKLRVVVGTLGLIAAACGVIPLFLAFDTHREHGLEMMLSVGFIASAGLLALLGADLTQGGALILEGDRLTRTWRNQEPVVIDLGRAVRWRLWQTAIQMRPVQVMVLEQDGHQICLNCFDDHAVGPPGPMQGDSMGPRGQVLWERLKRALEDVPPQISEP